MIEFLTGIIILVILGLIVWFQFQSSKLPPNALLLFDVLQEIGGEGTPTNPQEGSLRAEKHCKA
ncbi:MAG: hypothetical protein OEL83_17180 [Desulforhopalus sp.]|nr:hypothetical protein [Desulforhopalus sp.]